MGTVPRIGWVGATDTAAGPSGAVLFNKLWEALADVLGTAATAVLLRRAAQRAVRRCPQLATLVIEREDLEYRYALPPAWEDRGEVVPQALRELIGELRPLLVELTGPVVIRHLEQVPELREQLVTALKDGPR